MVVRERMGEGVGERDFGVYDCSRSVEGESRREVREFSDC